MNIVLFGYRGSGKSTIGRLLAERLDRPFIDTDARVRERFGGIPISEIWQRHGEEAFRHMECIVTADTLRRDRQVVALGGGTVMQHDARAAIEDAKARDRALCVYLGATAETLYHRIHSDDTTLAERPALTDKGGGIDEIQHVLTERGVVYEALADHIVDVNHMSPERAVDHIAALL